jgi:hypothetical protein
MRPCPAQAIAERDRSLVAGAHIAADLAFITAGRQGLPFRAELGNRHRPGRFFSLGSG